MEQNGWIALGAASALGLGLLAAGAVTAATAMPLADTSTPAGVTGISDVRTEAKVFAGAGENRISVPGSPPEPSASPTTSAATASAAEPGPAVTQAPVPQPAPAAPISVTSPPSPVSPDDSGSDDD